MKILINSRPYLTRIASIKGNHLMSLKVFNPHCPSQVGYVYKGRVTKIIPSLQACFVDIGRKEEAFMHINEIKIDAVPSEMDINFQQNNNDSKKNISIQNIIQPNQKVLVQVKTDAIGSKRARLTMRISLAGRYLVYTPQSTGVGVSRRIEDIEERERLIQCIERLEPKGGVIIRTMAEGKEDFEKDLKNLYEQWEEIQKNNRNTTGIVHKELNSELQFLRDEFNSAHVYIDNFNVYEQAVQFIEHNHPQLKNKLIYYNKPEPLFEKFGIENKWAQALERKVNLKSGGSIIIDENEAMVNIDVNTGRFISKKSQKETILKTNIEAVKEIARQLRLRNCGGIIIIDLIDVDSEQEKSKIMKQFEKELKKDPVYTEIISLSSLHLIQMTRKRTRESLKNILCEICPFCKQRGVILSAYTVACGIFRELESTYGNEIKNNNSAFKKIQIICHPHVIHWIDNNEMQSLEFLKKTYNLTLSFKENSSPYVEEFKILSENLKSI